jgi:hypothetical protein
MDSESPEDGSKANTLNVLYIKNTYGNEQFP